MEFSRRTTPALCLRALACVSLALFLTPSAHSQATSAPAGGAAPAGSATSPAPPTQEAMDDAKAKLETLEKAVADSKAGLAAADSAKTHAANLLDAAYANPLPTLDADNVKLVGKASDLLAQNAADGAALKQIESTLQAAVAPQKTLADALKAFVAVQSNLDAQYKIRADAATGSASTLAAAMSTIQTTMIGDDPKNSLVRARVHSLYGFTTPLYKSLQARLSANPLPGLAGDKDAPKPDALRSKLPGNVNAIVEIEMLRLPLDAGWTALDTKLATIFDKDDHEASRKEVEALRDVADKAADSVRTKLPAWITILHDDVTQQSSKVTKSNDNIRAAMKATPRNASVIATGPPLLTATTEELIAYGTVVPEIDKVVGFWSDKKLDVQTAPTLLGQLKAGVSALGRENEILSDIMAGDQERFVQDQVRLFYFTDVTRLLHALRPDNAVSTWTNEDVTKAKTLADKTRDDLLNTEGDILALTREIGELQDRVRTVQEDLRRTDAQLNDVTNRADIAQRRIDSLTRQKLALTTRESTLTTQIGSITNSTAAANKDRDALVTQRDSIVTQLKAITDPAMIASLNTQLNTVISKITKIDSDNAERDAKLKALQSQKDRLDSSIADQSNTLTQLSSAQSQIAQQRADLVKEQTSLPADLETARKALIAKQTERAKAKYLQSRQAADEAAAFGAARDNAPFYYTQPDASSSDPIKRVFIFGYDDSKTIYIRGLAEDIDRVKAIIAGYDRPAPQARITLWTLQMSGSNNNKLNSALRNVDDTLRDLRGSILLIQDALRDSINKVVNDVAACHAAKLTAAGIPLADMTRLARYAYYNNNVLSALGVQPKTFDVSSTGATEDEKEGSVGSTLFLTRWTLPDPAHATTLGEMLFVFSLGKELYRRQILREFGKELALQYWTIKDLRNKDKNGQVGVQRRFIVGFFKQLDQSDIDWIVEETKSVAKDGAFDALKANLKSGAGSLESSYPHFPAAMMGTFIRRTDATKAAANQGTLGTHGEPKTVPHGADNGPSTSGSTSGSPGAVSTTAQPITMTADNRSENEPITSNQQEIVTALQSKARETISAEIRYILRQIGDLTPSERTSGDTASLLREQYTPLLGYLYSRFYTNSSQPEVTEAHGGAAPGAPSKPKAQPGAPAPPQETANKAATTSKQARQLAQNGRWHALGLEALKGSLPGLSNASSLSDIPREKLLDADRAAFRIANLVRDTNSLSQATPRVAAADDMIKRLIIVFEDDLEYFFVADALESLRKNAREGVSLGVLQRESILATNREVARIDPRATANLDLAAGTDFLNQAQQLAQIAGNFKQNQVNQKLTSSLPAFTTGIAGLAQSGAGNAFAFGGLASLFGDLLSRPQDPPGEVYSINTGNLFKVTPIFDPSGQALRFKFDYSATVNVQEPSGTTIADPSRIDRHTVNTEVQLTNLEFREISRFESNSKLGLPDYRTGGLPIIKEIPILRDIPILGYYFRRKGSAAARQESIIFAQSSLYPTVGDIANLLTDVPARSDLDPDIPSYLIEAPKQDKATTAPSILSSVSFDPSATVTSGSAAVGIVTLSAPAKTYVDIKLTSGEPSIVKLPNRDIVIPKGQTSAAFPIRTQSDLKSLATVFIQATADNDGTTKVGLLNVKPADKPASSMQTTPAPAAPAIAAVLFPGKSILGGNPITGTVELSDPAPVGSAKISLSIDGAKLGADTVTVPGGSVEGKFVVVTSPVDKPAKIVVTATSGGSSKTGIMYVQPPVLASIDAPPQDNGAHFLLKIKLTGAAGPSGLKAHVKCTDSPYLAYDQTVTVTSDVFNLLLKPQRLPTGVKPPQTATIKVTVGDVTLSKKIQLVR